VRIANPVDQELQGKLASSRGSIGPLAEGFETGRVGGRDVAGCRKTGNEERAPMHSQLLGRLGDSVAQRRLAANCISANELFQFLRSRWRSDIVVRLRVLKAIPGAQLSIIFENELLAVFTLDVGVVA